MLSGFFITLLTGAFLGKAEAAVCPVLLTRALSVGSENAQVLVLQKFLHEEEYLLQKPSGFFGLATKGALQKFQHDVSILETGMVTAETREKITIAMCPFEDLPKRLFNLPTDGTIPQDIDEENAPPIGLSIPEQRRILSEHNEARSAVGVSSLAWSYELAVAAKAWADTISSGNCNVRHATYGERDGTGENIWAGFNYTIWAPVQMVRDWTIEKEDYSHRNNTCEPGKICGHYTQIVWDRTKEVGCGMAACIQNGDEGRVFVCRYDPAGNILGTKPY